MKTKLSLRRIIIFLAVISFSSFALAGWFSAAENSEKARARKVQSSGKLVSAKKSKRVEIPKDFEAGKYKIVELRATGYCNCGKCCGWKRSWFGFGPPVFTSGSLKGKRKEVGVTASGFTARHGTIAADPKLFPFGTRIIIPGYGGGVVEDVGGAIKGKHIDLWFPSHWKALKWGSRTVKVKVEIQ